MPIIKNLISYSEHGIKISEDFSEEFIRSHLPTPEHSISMLGFRYKTLDAHGKSHTASATLTLPISLEQSFPMISYQHGTLTERNKVSSIKGFETENDGFISKLFASQGFATVIPDYLGFGVSNILHPYLHAATLASSTRDAIVAAKQLCEEVGLKLSKELFLTGYSEGGHATMAAQELIQRKPIEGLLLSASAPLAGPYDLSETMLEIMLNKEPYPAPAYAPFILLAYNEIYDFADTSELFRAPFDEILPVLFDGNYERSEIEMSLPQIPIEVLSEEFIQAIIKNPDHPIRNAIKLNDTFRFSPHCDTRLFHCPSDKTVPIQNAHVAIEYF